MAAKRLLVDSERSKARKMCRDWVVVQPHHQEHAPARDGGIDYCGVRVPCGQRRQDRYGAPQGPPQRQSENPGASDRKPVLRLDGPESFQTTRKSTSECVGPECIVEGPLGNPRSSGSSFALSKLSSTLGASRIKESSLSTTWLRVWMLSCSRTSVERALRIASDLNSR